MRSSRGVVLCLLGIAWAFSAWSVGGAGGEGWDISVERTIDYSGARFCNPCANPPQVLEITAGGLDIRGEMRKKVGEVGTQEGWEVRLHVSHQGTRATGSDLVVNETGEMLDADGKVVSRCGQAAVARDANGESITSEYSIPGHFQYVRSIANEGDVATATDLFVCHAISLQRGGNALVHLYGTITINDQGEFTFGVDKERLWCKCEGPADDGALSCEASPESCVDIVLY